MTSGEWDLRALKALEEEEQKEFLALSQKNLFEPPSPPKQKQQSPTSQLQLQLQHQHHNQQLHVPLQPTYASQFQPQLLKLPTINECNLITKRNSTRQEHTLLGTTAVSDDGGSRLKFTRALSLSAHSLSVGRDGSGAGGSGSASGSSIILGGGYSASGLFTNLGRRAKAKFALTKSSGSLSASQYSNSPAYTPPPIRRCATLHHTQPVRKAFKTLQQLEKQRQERKKTEAEKTTVAFASNVSTRHKSPQLQLQRVAGTNKTYWKYGANSTAASIVGQRTQQQEQQQQQQQKLEQQTVHFRSPVTSTSPATSFAVDLESNTSEEYGDSEDAAASQFNFYSNNNNSSANIKNNGNCGNNSNNNNDEVDALYYDDSATETGSCSVPLATDSIEMMRLMLSEAKTAVTATQQLPVIPTTTSSSSATTASTLSYMNLNQRIPTPDIAVALARSATSGTGVFDDYQHERQEYHSKAGSGNSSTFTTLTRRYQQQQQQEQLLQLQQQHQQKHQQQQPSPDPNETVALKAFHAIARRKSFSGGVAGVTRYGETLLHTSIGNNSHPQDNSNVNDSESGRRLLKSSSVETPTCTVEYNSVGSSGSNRGLIIDNKLISGIGMQRSTIITNPIVECIKSSSTVAVTSPPLPVTGATSHMCNFLKERNGRTMLRQQRPHQNSHHRVQQQQHATAASLLCHELNSANNGSALPLTSPSSSSSPVIEDEMEQHIKHCSCSCNHMGYGNSMDYQVSGIWID